MVNHRLNERETNPNKHINFISALPTPDVPNPYSEEDARQLLRALAAQVRPIMKARGFEVNSFEEYEYNRVFAGRNWNNGETIGQRNVLHPKERWARVAETTSQELVLRHAEGTFMSIPWLLGTLCHELAHIKHMNHGRDFQKLWNRLRDEVTALQARGYYGDGYWSSGSRLADSAQVGGNGIVDYDLPEYVCGGAQGRSRPKSYGRRRTPRRFAGPSRHTGAQTERRRKPGARVTAKDKFKGEGAALNVDISDEDLKAKGTGFRKQAGSKRAREERGLAAEKRLKALQGKVNLDKDVKEEDSGTEEDLDYGEYACNPAETDEMRRQTMKESVEDREINSSQKFMHDFLQDSSRVKYETPKDTAFSSIFDAIEISDDEDVGTCDLPSTFHPVISKPPSSTHKAVKSEEQASTASSAHLGSSSKSSQKLTTSLGLGRLVQEEMSLRKRESLGLTGGRMLGSGSNRTPSTPTARPIKRECNTAAAVQTPSGWACLVCTFENQPEHLACSVCATAKGDSSWTGQHV